jgi:hypothetical protein
MKKMLVFDIDQTLVDSSRRENLSFFRDNLDLAHYQKQKHDCVLGAKSDTLLPLGEVLELNDILTPFCLVTAREFEAVDFNVLGRLMPNAMLQSEIVINRNNCHLFNGDKREQSSGVYKKPVFDWLKTYYNRELVIIDDCPKVLQVARQNGHSAICARDLWHLSHDDIKQVLENALM